MARNLGVNIRIGADLKKFSTDMQNVQRQMKRQAGKMKQTGRAMTRALTLPLAAVGVASVKLSADFEQSMAKVKAVSGATGEEFKKLNDNALELGRTTRFTAGEVAELQLNLSKLGFNPKEITDSTEAILNLALASGEDLAQSATVAAGTMRGFGIATSESGRVADVMAKSFSSSGLDLEKFSVSMSKIAPVARAAGFSFEQTTAMMSALADANVEASTIGTSLRQIFIELASKGISYSDAMEQIRNSTNKTVTATDLFDKRAAAAAIILSENEIKVNDLSKAYLSAGGSAKEMAAIMDDTLQGSFMRLKSALEGAAIQIGEHLKPMVQSLTSFVTKMADGFNNLSESTQKVILGIGGVTAVSGPAILAMGYFVGALKNLGITMGRTKKGFTIFLKNPIMLTIGVVAALTAGIIALGNRIDNNHPILKKTRDVTNGLADANKNLKEQIDDVNKATSTGVEIDDVARQSMIKKTSKIIDETIAKIENARATKMQLIEEKKLALQRALSATRGVGQQGEFIGVEQSSVKAIESSIEELNQSLADTDKMLRNAYASYLKLKTGSEDGGLASLLDNIGNGSKKAGRVATSSDIVSMDAIGLSTNKWADSLKEAKDAIKELKPELKSIEPVLDSVSKYGEMMAERWQSTMQSMKDGVNDLISNTIADFAYSLGNMFNGGAENMESFGQRFLSSFGSFLGDFGKMLIAFGVARLALLKSVSLGPAGAVTAIAAGAALVAIGGAIGAHMDRLDEASTGMYTGGSSGYSPPSTGNFSSSYGNTSNVLTLETVVYGRDIVLSSNRQHGTISRTRRK